MSINGLVRSVAICGAIYGAHKLGEAIGFVKGTIRGCKLAKYYEDDAMKIANDWEEIESRWQELKARKA